MLKKEDTVDTHGKWSFSTVLVLKYETLDFNGHVPEKGRGARVEMKGLLPWLLGSLR